MIYSIQNTKSFKMLTFMSRIGTVPGVHKKNKKKKWNSIVRMEIRQYTSLKRNWFSDFIQLSGFSNEFILLK